MVTKALIAVGSNLPRDGRDSRNLSEWAIERLSDVLQTPVTSSRFFRTPAFPPESGPDFVNAACSVVWDGAPDALLALLHDIEAEAGRTRTRRWEARVLDLDLIALGDRVCPDAETQDAWRALSVEEASTRVPEGLILPHPRMQDRGFVLVPLADIAPDWRHPRLERTVSQMLDALAPEDLAEIKPL